MNDLNRNLLATVATQNTDYSDVLKELEAAKAELAEMEDKLAYANRFQNLFIGAMEGPLKNIVRDEVTQSIDHAMKANFKDLLEENFDIHDYNDEVNSMALEDFDINDYSNDLNISPDETETNDLIRDVLRNATFKMEV
tara:strand:- start:538 stop:954 length:417 start_codon:yes stop_codon:yes gene_type:complete